MTLCKAASFFYGQPSEHPQVPPRRQGRHSRLQFFVPYWKGNLAPSRSRPPVPPGQTHSGPGEIRSRLLQLPLLTLPSSRQNGGMRRLLRDERLNPAAGRESRDSAPQRWPVLEPSAGKCRVFGSSQYNHKRQISLHFFPPPLGVFFSLARRWGTLPHLVNIGTAS